MGVKVRMQDGSWYVFINHKNRRKAKKIGSGPQAKRQAEEAARRIEARLTLGDVGILEPRVLTFGEHCAEWLDGYVSSLKPRTQENYRDVMRLHWLPVFQDTPLSEVGRQAIKRVVQSKLTHGMQHSTVRNLLDTLHACLAVAVGEGALASNPVTRYGKWIMRLPAKRKHIDIFTAPELQHLLRIMRDTNPRGYPILLLLARTGLRIGEALTLQLGDLDLVKRELWVRRTWGSRRASLSWPERINTPKSGERRVDMSQQLCTVLRDDLAKHRRPGIWLFPAKGQDRPMTPQNFQSVYWAPLFRSKLFAYRNVHVLRHTCASLMLANGESLHYIKQQLGHSSIRITVDVYGHLLPGGNKLAVDPLDEPTRKSSASGKKLLTLSH